MTVNYAFQSGFVKGSWVGMSYRWLDKQVVGFGLNADSTGYDVSKRIYGPTRMPGTFGWAVSSRSREAPLARADQRPQSLRHEVADPCDGAAGRFGRHLPHPGAAGDQPHEPFEF
jgi:hypothetical protein